MPIYIWLRVTYLFTNAKMKWMEIDYDYPVVHLSNTVIFFSFQVCLHSQVNWWKLHSVLWIIKRHVFIHELRKQNFDFYCQDVFTRELSIPLDRSGMMAVTIPVNVSMEWLVNTSVHRSKASVLIQQTRAKKIRFLIKSQDLFSLNKADFHNFFLI